MKLGNSKKDSKNRATYYFNTSQAVIKIEIKNAHLETENKQQFLCLQILISLFSLIQILADQFAATNFMLGNPL